MYDTSSRFLSQICADRRASLLGSREASARHPFTRPLRAAGARVRDRLSGQGPKPSAIVESSPLTRREHEIVMLVAEGLTNAQIAERLWISPGTVRRHLENVFTKLDVHTRTAAVAQLVRASTRDTADGVSRRTGGTLRPHVDVDGAGDVA